MVKNNSFCKKWPKFCWPQFLQFVLSTLLMQQLMATLIMELLVQKSFKQGMMEQLGIILVQDINLLGLHYTRLPTIFYLYCAALLFILTSFSRYGGWLRKDSSFSIFVLFGLIEMDWLSLMAVVFFDLLLCVTIVEIFLWKIWRRKSEDCLCKSYHYETKIDFM